MFGKPAFGAAAPSTSFGGFGQPATTANPFGQNQSLFGKPATGFGPSTSTFGQPATSGLFTSQPQQTNLFQTNTSTFGAAPTTQTGFGSTGLFGQQPSAGGLFNSTSTFGQQNKPTGFGFGATQQNPTLFGAQQVTQTQGSSIFNPTGNTGLFGGSTAFSNQQAGTVIKFNPVTGADTMMKNGSAQNISTKHHSITCMKEYENKSFEELRYEDYQANRKGPQQSTGFGGQAFGGPTLSTPSLFSQNDANKPAVGHSTGFGQTTGPFGNTSVAFGLHNQPNNSASTFGKPIGFTAPTNSTGFGFGTNPAPNANPFGAATANKPFGTSTAQPLFGGGTTLPNSSGFGTGLFSGSQNTGTGLFNKPTQPTTGFGQSSGLLFNTPTTTQPSLFTNTSKPLFGGGTTGTAPGFGGLNQPTQPTLFSSSFGKPTTTPFGTTPTTGFGTSLGGLGTNQGSLFGPNNQQKPGGMFTGGPNLFANTATPFQTNTFGLGQPQQQQPSLLAQPEQQHNNLALLTTDPFGDAPHLAGLEPKLRSNTATVSATDPKELKSLLDASKKVDMSHNSKLKVTPLKSARDSLFETIPNSSENTKSPLADYRKTSCRRLILKSRTAGENVPGMNSTNILDVLTSEDKENRNLDGSGGGRANPLRLNFDVTVHNDSLVNNTVETQTFNIVNSTTKDNFPEHSVRESPPPPSDDEDEVINQGSGDAVKKHPANIVCTRPEYYTLPNLDDLVPNENLNCFVKGFTIGRKGYGNVYFPDEVDVAGLNIDELVHFRYREINVYPDESKKPPVGQGLNRKAQVTLDNVYPRRTGSNVLMKDVGELMQMNFAEKLRKVTEKKNARFVDYRPETGSWVFKVDHFSKYGFNDSDEETEQNGTGTTKKAPQKTNAKQAEVLKVPKPAETITKESLEEKDTENEVVRRETPDRSGEQSSGFRLDKDILIDDEEQEENDVLHHSMFVDDASEEDYHQIPAEMPMDLHFGSYTKNANAKNIQVMKSTLFADDDRSSAGSHVSIMKQYLDLPEMDDIPRMPTLREEEAVRKRPMLRPKVWKVLNSSETSSSTISNVLPNRSCMDMGMFKGKSFKVGWSKGFSFYSVDKDDCESNGELALKRFDASPSFDPLKDVLTDSLKVVLEESTYQLNSAKIPTFKILKTDSYLKKQSAIFEKLAAQYNSKHASYLHSIWTLCTALWGPNENTIANRRHLLSQWLRVTCNTDEITLKNGPFNSVSDVTETIFMYLSVFKVLEAAGIAMDNRLPNLSLLIAQLSVPNVTKSFIQEQIEIWYNSMASNHISDEMKRLYLLLSGMPVKDEVNIFDNVDWKRAFGMHLWYICPNGAPVETAIEHYKKSFEEYSYAERPNPPYMEKLTEDGSFDIMYHILLLYKSGIHRLSSVLNPPTHTDDPLDYRLSWLLLQLFQSLDVGLIETSEKNKLSISFSNQLEQLGHWEWSIFALLHLEDNSVKKNVIMGILDRNLSADFDDNSQEIVDLLVNDMKIPAEWIHLVKAPKALALERFFEAFNHYSMAEEYILANNVFVDNLLPSLFINEQFDVIRSLIEKLKPGSKDILHWNNEAGLFLEYLDLLDQSISSDNLMKLQMKLCSISERIVNFPLTSDQQKVCAAELSKRCASLYKELSKKSQSHTLKDSYVQFIETLIMPPDFKQNEGLYLIHDFYNFRINVRQ